MKGLCRWGLAGFVALWAISPARAESRGLDVEAARIYSESTGGTALLVELRGRCLTESYAGGTGPATRHNLKSITKSFVALGLLAAANKGDFEIEEPDGGGLFPGDLLRQVAGLPPARGAFYGRRPRDKSAAARALAPQAARDFSYGPSSYERVVALLEARLGSAPAAEQCLRSRLLVPLGAGNLAWERDQKGSVYGSAGLHGTPDNLLAVGRLVARGGWVGWRRIIPGKLLSRALEGSRQNPAYGMGFWLNANAPKPNAEPHDIEKALDSGRTNWQRFCLSRHAPPQLAVMAGSGGQRVYVDPETDLVVVRLGRGNDFSDTRFLDALYGRSGRAN